MQLRSSERFASFVECTVWGEELEVGSLELGNGSQLDARDQKMMDNVAVLIRDSETRLVQAFYSFAEANQKRLTEVARGGGR